VMDVEVVTVPGDRLTGAGLDPVLAAVADRAFAVVATAGSTNLGLVDDLASVAEACRRRGTWLHVDGAYGGAALAAPSARHRFAGIEHADSFIVDPHKWLFAPFDACALLYRDPELARATHAQHADYLDVLHGGEWNPSDYAVHLSRRARGLPLWFSLAAYGAAAYAEAVETCLRTAREAAELVRAAPHLELVLEPELSVVVLRRPGWSADDYRAWSLALLRSGEGFVVPSAHRGEPMVRLCIVNTRSSAADVAAILDSMR
jgi:L-2,4-diaminobutyrate decarboxylase